jgi:CRISPR type I-E-associated protein CasB/Cse2
MDQTGLAAARHRFTSWLASLVERDDRGALAALRTGRMGGKTMPGFWRVVLPHLPDDLPAAERLAWFGVAAMVGAGVIPDSPDPAAKPWTRNLGAAIRRALGDDGVNDPAMAARLEALLAAPEQGTAIERIRWLTPSLKREPVDLWLLIRDLANWEDENGWTQRNWARSLWGGSNVDHTDPAPEHAG